MTVIIVDNSNEAVEKMAVDETSSDNSYVKTPPQIRRKKKKRPTKPIMGTTFADLYKLTGETLGEGSYGKVDTCKNVFTGIEYAVKTIEKRPGTFNRSKVLKEIEIYHLCRGMKNIIQLIEFFEEADYFYLVFEKIEGGPLLKQIQQRVCFSEAEAAIIVKDLSEAIKHLHSNGVAHRDLKPDNVLCVHSNAPFPVKLCDFDLSSSVCTDVSTPQLLSPVGSLEYMAPEVVEAFIASDYDDPDEDEDEISYNKKCDMWSLGVIMYILLCGYAPFQARCDDLDCDWDQGGACETCQRILFNNIQAGNVIFPEQHWSKVSSEAKDLIQNLLVLDLSSRFTAEQVLQHRWVTNGGSSNILKTSENLRQFSFKEVEDLASRASNISRTVDRKSSSEHIAKSSPIDIPVPQHKINLSPPNLSSCSLLQRRRKSKDKFSKFSSIDELESDFFMKSIC